MSTNISEQTATSVVWLSEPSYSKYSQPHTSVSASNILSLTSGYLTIFTLSTIFFSAESKKSITNCRPSKSALYQTVHLFTHRIVALIAALENESFKPGIL
jgi:hypothetical protein